jgi:hypothetical protein
MKGAEDNTTFNKRRKFNWICHILPRNCLLKHVTEGKIEGISDGKTIEKT